MRYVQIANRANGAILGDRIGVAEWWWQRLRGLLGRPPLRAGEGLLLTPCQAIHMAGMKYPLDVVFLDQQSMVVAVYPRISPGGRTRWHASVRSALELPVGTLDATSTQVGDTLVCLPAHGGAPDGCSEAGPQLQAVAQTESVLRMRSAEHSAA